jgi:hypothetical protein
MTRGSAGAYLSQEARSGAIRHVTALEPTPTEMRDPEPYDKWQRQSPPQLGGEVQSHRTRGSTGPHLSWEARSGAVRHVAVCGCMSYKLS